MKIRLLSDLHLEFSGNKFKHIWTPCEEDKHVTLLLAGDIGVGLGARRFVEALCNSFKHVLFICGNHEFYHNDHAEIIKRWCDFGMGVPNFHFLNNDCRIIDGVRFLGGTMWTSLNNGDIITCGAVQSVLEDYNCIKRAGFLFSPNDVMDEHNQFIDFLLKEFDKPFDGPTVVMTHHSPGNIQRSRRSHSLTDYAYYAELENMIGTHNKARLWVHGHLHDSTDYMINETRVVCNPYGYNGNGVNPNFDKHFSLNLEF